MHKLWWWYLTWPDGLRIWTLGVLTLCSYVLPPIVGARLVARNVRRHEALARGIFGWVRRLGRRRLLPVMALGVFAAVFSTFDSPTEHPVDELWQRVPAALPGMLILCACQTLLLLSWIDEGGFRIETTGRDSASLHVHRDLDKVGTRAFVLWLPGALLHCHSMGMHTVSLVSPLLHDTSRVDRLMAAIHALELRVDGTNLLVDTRKIRGSPMVGPFAWSYWRRYGRFQRPVRRGEWGMWRKLIARVWRPQSGLQVQVRASSETRPRMP
ncbi:hypothetical protein [Burkholderia gladioli]|uniref:hypothetical protein n=1 Tax=Burkholderia gladioli TaxID=28095 RepID=UPI0016411907|nr:hypothetical protein [Burkholderia gladioli]